MLSMDRILEIINKRSVPGILILDMTNTLLYANRKALELIPAALNCTSGEAEERRIPDEILSLCDRLKISDPAVITIPGDISDYDVVEAFNEKVCSLRAFFIGNPAGDEKQQHIMVLIEGIIEKHEVDFDKAKQDYRLSKREIEILQCICQGLTNKEIATIKFISEYTVKDHIKKIMKNMGVNSRSEIIAALR